MAQKHPSHPARRTHRVIGCLATVAALLSGISVSAETRFVTSKDGTKIAYDVTGTGPAVILLHGGGQNRQVWHKPGYVARLAKEFTVISIDIRGNGESDKPAHVSAYHFERINEDILAVADAIKASRFSLWGFCTARTSAVTWPRARIA